MSSQQKPGLIPPSYRQVIGDYTTHVNIGIVINHDKDAYEPTSIITRHKTKSIYLKLGLPKIKFHLRTTILRCCNSFREGMPFSERRALKKTSCGVSIQTLVQRRPYLPSWEQHIPRWDMLALLEDIFQE